MMEEIRCPMCGKSNPAEEGTCRSCGARLTPLVAHGSAEPSESEESIPQWLSELGKSEQETPEPTPSEEEPDWLREIGITQPDAAESGEKGESDPEDYLANLFGQQESEPLAAEPADETDGSAWLHQMKIEQEPLPEDVPHVEIPPEDSLFADLSLEDIASEESFLPVKPNAESSGLEADTSDWLASLEDSASEAALPVTPSLEDLPQNAEYELPPWYQSLEAETRPKPSRTGQDEVPVWLSSLHEEPETPQKPSDLAEGEIPDWLQSFTPPEAAEPQASSTAETDWMLEMAEETDTEPSLEADLAGEDGVGGETMPLQSAAADEETLPWLREAAAGEELPSAEAAIIDEIPSPEEGESPSWLRQMEDEGEQEPERSLSAVEEGETPGWLGDMMQETELFPRQNDEEEPVVWLPFQAEDQGSLEAESPKPADEEESLDWLGEMAQETEAVPGLQSEEETPSWLQSLQPEEEGALEAESPTLADEEEESLDWLGEMAQETEAVPGLQSEAESLDWLGELPQETKSPAEEIEPLADEFAGDGAPGFGGDAANLWLDNEKLPEESPVEQPSIEEGIMPNWLKQETGATSFYEEPAEAEKMPEWLASEAGGTQESPAEEEDIPDWLAAGAVAVGMIPPPSKDETTADWMIDSEQVEAVDSQEEPAEEGEFPPEETQEETLSYTPIDQEFEQGPAIKRKTGSGSLEEAQLPGWLDAMRPVTSLEQGGVQKGELETTGPLAGLRGTLPGRETVVPYRIPPVYSMRVTLSDTQRSHALLMEQILGEEMRSQVDINPQRRTSSVLGRLLVGLLLILTVCIPLFSGSMDTALPDLYPASLVTFFQANESLAEQSPVLIIVDYNPGFDGELRTVAAPVIEHLMAKNARIALLSTDPAGPALGQNLLQRTLIERNISYALSEQTINLGYLPGGVTAIRQFAIDPPSSTRYAFGSGLDQRNPWIHPSLTGVKTLSDFSQVILITPQLETARAWIEQTQSALDGTRLYVITSAQTSPLLQPYVESGSVAGMAGGLTDAAMYVQFINQPGVVRSYWDSYQYSILLIILLIILGALFQLVILPLTTKSKRSRRAKA